MNGLPTRYTLLVVHDSKIRNVPTNDINLSKRHFYKGLLILVQNLWISNLFELLLLIVICVQDEILFYYNISFNISVQNSCCFFPVENRVFVETCPPTSARCRHGETGLPTFFISCRVFMFAVIERRAECFNTPALYLGSFGFRSLPGDPLVFLSYSRQMPEAYLELFANHPLIRCREVGTTENDVR